MCAAQGQDRFEVLSAKAMALRVRVRGKTSLAHALAKSDTFSRRKRRAQAAIARKQAKQQAGVPKARRPFAIFFAEFASNSKGAGGPASIRAAAAAWRALPNEEKVCYRDSSRKEFASARKASEAAGIAVRPWNASTPLPAECNQLPEATGSCPSQPVVAPPVCMTAGGYKWSTDPSHLVGRGAFGSVFVGTHERTKQLVAVKLVDDEDAVKHEGYLLRMVSNGLGFHKVFPELLLCSASSGFWGFGAGVVRAGRAGLFREQEAN